MTGTRRSPAVPAFMVIVATALAAQLIGTLAAVVAALAGGIIVYGTLKTLVGIRLDA